MEDSIMQYLPQRIVQGIDSYRRAGRSVEEICLYRGQSVLLVCNGENLRTGMTCTAVEFEQTFLRLCEDSVYAHADTIRNGYISIRNGGRVGVCGSAVGEGDEIRNVKEISSLHLRLPKVHTRSSNLLYQRLRSGGFSQSVLVYSAPGVGKTTLLRDLAYRLAGGSVPLRVCVVDSRREFSPEAWTENVTIDHLCGYPKAKGMEIALRTLSPQYLICDEIGNESEAQALLHVMHSGVRFVAAAHGDELADLLLRPFLAELHRERVFDLYCGIFRKDRERYLKIQGRDDL